MNCLIGLIEPHYNPTSKVLIQQIEAPLISLYFLLENLQTSQTHHCHGRVLPSKSTLVHCFSSANFLINNSVFNLRRKTKINLSNISLSLLLSENNLHNLVKWLPPFLFTQFSVLTSGYTTHVTDSLEF